MNWHNTVESQLSPPEYCALFMLRRFYTFWQLSFTSHAIVQNDMRFRLKEELINYREPDRVTVSVMRVIFLE